jgi:hypothetical protein
MPSRMAGCNTEPNSPATRCVVVKCGDNVDGLLRCDRIVVETNNGGDLVEATRWRQDPHVQPR